jgi:hypothetical protein
MQLSELWLEDLFRIYLRSTEPLDRGPYQGRPARYNSRDFGNPSELDVRDAILEKLRIKRAQEAVDALGWYVRFINEQRAVDETLRQRLLDLIRSRPRVFVSDMSHFHAGIRRLQAGLGSLERRIWGTNSSDVRLYNSLGDRIGVWRKYYSILETFIDAIGHMAGSSGPVYYGGRVVLLEVDFLAHRSLLLTVRFLSSPHAQNRDASQAALDAWNGLSPHARSAVAGHVAPTRREFVVELDRLRRSRSIDISYP